MPGSVGAVPKADQDVPELLLRFQRHAYAEIDPVLPGLLEVLAEVGAHDCFHKKSTFFQHLFQVYKMLKVWGQDDVLCKAGLMHSAYSNSYVNMALFSGDTDRPRVAQLVGEEVEGLIHMWCVLPRHDAIYTALLDKVPDDGPLEVPKEGVTVAHIKTGEPLPVDVYELGRLLVFTMADFAEQLHSWQDDMFDNSDGRLCYAGNQPACLWPGEMKPGRWMSTLSRMGALAASCNRRLQEAGDERRVVLPPVFDGCTALLSREDELAARDAYWKVVTELRGPHQEEEALALLAAASMRNPWMAEPHLLSAQIHMHRREWGAGEAAAARGLRLLCQWATTYDKRMVFEAWLAWARVLLQSSRKEVWPTTAFGMLNLGLVT